MRSLGCHVAYHISCCVISFLSTTNDVCNLEDCKYKTLFEFGWSYFGLLAATSLTVSLVGCFCCYQQPMMSVTLKTVSTTLCSDSVDCIAVSWLPRRLPYLLSCNQQQMISVTLKCVSTTFCSDSVNRIAVSWLPCCLPYLLSRDCVAINNK